MISSVASLPGASTSSPTPAPISARASGAEKARRLVAGDAALLDTGAMTADQAIAAAIALVDDRLA